METQSFYDFLEKKFPIKTSRSIPSYKKALLILDELFKKNDIFNLNGIPLKDLKDPVLVAKLVDFIDIEEQKFRDGNPSSFFNSGIPIPPSYVKGRFCRAAIRQLRDYINDFTNEESIATLNEHRGDGERLSKKLITRFQLNTDKTETEAIVNRRIGQDIFRSILLKIYDNKCCLTGLNIPEVLRASHIIPWSDDTTNRLNPENGLCLSATYDAAFDKNLISFDEDYRLILSKELKEHYSSEAYRTHFLKLEGISIQLPSTYLPSQKFLAEHRKHLRS